MNTTDGLGRALADLAARADTDSRSDRVVSVHRRARRTARTRAVGASVAVALVFGTGVALVTRSQNGAAPLPPAGPVATLPSVQSTLPAPSSPVPSMVSTPTQAPTHATAPAAHALVPADSRFPAAGGCPPVAGAVVTIDANPDVPTPRCVQIRADQRLRVVNTSDLLGSPPKTITVTFGNFAPRVLRVGQSTTFDRPAGDYLAVGVHWLDMPPLYAGSHGEIWLR